VTNTNNKFLQWYHVHKDNHVNIQRQHERRSVVVQTYPHVAKSTISNEAVFTSCHLPGFKWLHRMSSLYGRHMCVDICWDNHICRQQLSQIS